jgi:hypothetical protein
MLGIAPDLALAVALVKRARELAYGLPGLIAWSLRGSASRWTRSAGERDATTLLL